MNAQDKNLANKYQQKTDKQNILDNPDTYIGSVEKIDSQQWILNDDNSRIFERNIEYVPGLFKLFDEGVVNARDHSVRMAQAINSDIKSAGLKYITKYINAEDADRVYIEHTKIGKMYQEKEEYFLNINNGKYKLATDYPDLDIKFPKVYKRVTGDKLVEAYLDDDLEETMRVDSEFSQASFLLAKMVPLPFERIYTMGTAGLWKTLMLHCLTMNLVKHKINQMLQNN
jgi:hypothetical protein